MGKKNIINFDLLQKLGKVLMVVNCCNASSWFND